MLMQIGAFAEETETAVGGTVVLNEEMKLLSALGIADALEGEYTKHINADRVMRSY